MTIIRAHSKERQDRRETPKLEPTLEERVAKRELRDMEVFNLMTVVISDSLAEALTMQEQEEREEWQDNELPVIEDRRSFLAYVSMVARHLKEKRLTASEGRGLLYAAQLSYAALKGTEPDVVKPSAAMPQLP